MNGVTVRTATVDDVIDIAAVWTASLRSTFSGLITRAQLASYTQMGPNVDVWRRLLSDPARHAIVAVVDGVICGVVEWCPMPARPLGQEALPEFDAYLQHLYVLAAVQWRGIGRALVHAAAGSLRERRYTGLALHVLTTNPAVAFYERLGGTRVRTDPAAGGTPLPHHVYGWRNLDGL